MTFPVVVANAASPWNGETASIALSLPTGTTVGDLLLMIFNKRGSTAPTFSGTGWTLLDSKSSGGNFWAGIYYKIADGNDGGTFTHNQTVNSSFVVYRITGFDAGAAPQLASIPSTTTATPNPPALTPSWGSADTLWVTALAFGEWPALTSYPAIATDNRRLAGQAAAWGSRSAMATWNAAASSQDPGNWVLEYGFPCTTWTIAVRPASLAVVPGAPTIGTATAGNQTVSIAFTPPADNGGPAPTSYTATLSPGGITKAGSASPIVFGAGDGIVNGTSYTGTVTATNSVGTGSASAASNLVTPAPATTPPGAPTGVNAAAGDGAATVSFSAPAPNGGPAVLSYTVTSSPGGATMSGSASPLVVSGLTNGTSYTFTVTATNADGTGPASAPSNAVTPAAIAYSITSPVGGFALNTGSAPRAAGVAFSWWAFAGKVIGDSLGGATMMAGAGTLDGSGRAVIAGLPLPGSWECQVRFADGGTARWTGTAA